MRSGLGLVQVVELTTIEMVMRQKTLEQKESECYPPLGRLTGVGFLHLGRESGIGNRESGIGNREKREMGRIIPEIIVYFDTYFEEFIRNQSTYLPLCKKPTLVSSGTGEVNASGEEVRPRRGRPSKLRHSSVFA
ncbi:MAG: hypothetical protein F6K26_49410 [Moorea sp. SIO2I5]|nr:hypothetical protein [Moorena sp. SIO2I5]